MAVFAGARYASAMLRTITAALAILIAGPAAAGSAVLNWIAPTQNTDGSPLVDLAGYRIEWGCGTLGQWPNERWILQPNLVSFLVEALPDTGTCFFRVSALNAGRVPTATAPSWTSAESQPSNVSSKVMNPNPPARPYTRATAIAPQPPAVPFEVLQAARLRVGFAGDPLRITVDATSSPTSFELRAVFVQSGEVRTQASTSATIVWTPPFAGLWYISTRACNATGCGDWRNGLEDGALYLFRVKAPTGGGIE